MNVKKINYTFTDRYCSDLRKDVSKLTADYCSSGMVVQLYAAVHFVMT